jgi:tetratricopeptide (TPR) repeat protein
MGKAYVGISGWTYAGWRGEFYPPGLAHRRELEYASRQLNSIEINGTFYSLQRPSSYERWRDTTPRGFRFAVKGSRFITHMKQLRDVEVPLANFFASGVLRLERTLGPFLWQFSDRMRYDRDRFERFLALLPRSARARGPHGSGGAAMRSRISTTTPRSARRSTRSAWRTASAATGGDAMQTDRIAALQRLLEKNPADTRLRFGLAAEYEKRGDWDSVVEQLRAYLAATDDEGNAWGRLGHALRQVGRDADARAAYTRGVAAAQQHGHPTMAAEFEEILADWNGSAD